MPFEFKFPDIGEGLTEGEIVRWLVKEGDAAKEGEALVEVETDKALAEIPSPRTGVVLKILAKEKEIVKVGQVIVVLGEKGGAVVAPLPAPATRRTNRPGRTGCPDRGILLIPGVEAAIEGKHTLLLDMPYSRLRVRSFDHVRERRRDGGLVIAPHPFFPAPKCLNGKLRENLDLFDALEFSHFYTRTIDFNRKTVEYARRMELPLVGNSDAHRLWQLGTTYTLLDAETRTKEAVFTAIRAGRGCPMTVRPRPAGPG